MEKFNDFEERINNGERVSLIEVYKQLGFDDNILLKNENTKLKREINNLVFENGCLKDDNKWLKNRLKCLRSEINKTLDGCAFKENDE